MIVKEYPLVTYAIDSDDIVISTITNVKHLDLQSAEELVRSRLDFMLDKKHYILIDMSKIQKFTLEAKHYMQDPEKGLKNILGAAFIASNPISILIANVFIKTRSNFPTKFFSGKNEALKWIKDIKNCK